MIWRTNEAGQKTLVSTSIIGDWRYTESRDIIEVFVNHKFIEMMQAGYTVLDWDIRLALPNFGKWLYGYVCTHAPGRKQYMTVQQMITAYGSHQARTRDFAQRQIIPALVKLEENGTLESWKIMGQVVSWTRAERGTG